MAFPVTGILDSFDRANEGPPPSASWGTDLGTGWKVISNECGPDTATTQASWNTSFKSPQEVYCTLRTPPAVGTAFILLCRYVTDYYDIQLVPQSGAGNDILQMWKGVSAVDTQLGADIALGADAAAGDVIGLRVLGSEIEIYYNGTKVASRTDTDVSGAGKAAILTTGTVDRIDDFGGGSVASRVVNGDVTGGHLVGGGMAR